MNEDVRNSMVAGLKQSIENGKIEDFANSVVKMNEDTIEKVESVKNQVLKEMEDFQNAKVLPKGFRQCTKDEKEWLDKVIVAAQNSTTSSYPIISDQMPTSLFNDIFEYVKTEHPLINEVNFIDTKGKAKWIVNTGIEGTAAWGDLCDEVTAEIKSGFKAIELPLYKLSAFSYICLTLLDLGYEWLMRYCVMCLGEAIAKGLEDAIVNGNGSKKPVGMAKDITVVDQTETISDKTAVNVSALDAATLGSICSTLSTGPNSVKRRVVDPILVCNTATYYTKVMPAISYRNALGEYAVRTAVPFRIVISEAVANNKALFGMGNKYDLMLGLGPDGKLTFSDEFKFLDDVRTVKQKVVANGRAKDNNAFVLLNVANLKPDYFNVKVTEEEASL